MEGVSSGGLGLIVQLVKRLKVAERIDERVRVLKRHLPYRESEVDPIDWTTQRHF